MCVEVHLCRSILKFPKLEEGRCPAIKQFSILYEGEASLEEQLEPVKEYWRRWESGILVHVFMTAGNVAMAGELSRNIRRIFPAAAVIGCCTGGNILNGDVSDSGTLLIFSVFEAVRVETIALPMAPGEEEKAAETLSAEASRQEEPKAVEFLVTVMKMDVSRFLSSLCISPLQLPVFGAGVIGLDPVTWEESAERAFLMTEKGVVENGVVAVAYYGAELHVCMEHVQGWKPLGMVMEATKSEGRILQKVDGEPAYEVYRKFLDIPKDKNFFRNSLGFPFLVKWKGQEVLRVPSSVTEEGYLFLPSGIPQHSKLRLTYGNPGEILRDVRLCCERLRKFSSQGALVYECVDRRAFWNAGIRQELSSFHQAGDVAGCFLEGEFLGTGMSVVQHECTLLIVGMREGSRKELPPMEAVWTDLEVGSEAAMLKRMAIFVQRSTEALQTAYQQMRHLNRELQLANEQLTRISKTDELTQLFNRREMERRIHGALEEAYRKSEDVSLILLDIDYFKRVNDTFGHAVGDVVLRRMAEIMQEAVRKGSGEAVGRWGGEEFIFLLPGSNLATAVERAEEVRCAIAAERFPNAGHQTVSIGVASSRDKIAKEIIFIRADEALYQAKAEGRNRVVGREA